MGSKLRKFVSRDPRYTLRPGDNDHMRFSPDAEPRNIRSSKILDLSSTGASFVIGREHAPFIFERIRIEVPLGETSIAWWAKVVRIQEFENEKWYKKQGGKANDEVIVGIQFDALPHLHVLRLQKELQTKFKKVDLLRKKAALQSAKDLLSHYATEAVFYAFIICFAVFLMWAWSRPTPFYDAEKGSPWGKRMWFVDKPDFESVPDDFNE